MILYSAVKTGDRRAGIEAARALMESYDEPAAAARLMRLEDYWSWERKRILRLTADGPAGMAQDALAMNAAAAGQIELAFSHLEEACRRKWPKVLFAVASDPMYIPLRQDPRFTRFLDCIRMPADAPARRGLPTAEEP